MKSIIREIGPVTFPQFSGERIYMQPFLSQHPDKEFLLTDVAKEAKSLTDDARRAVNAMAKKGYVNRSILPSKKIMVKLGDPWRHSKANPETVMGDLPLLAHVK